MKTLLIGEYRDGKLLESTYELLGFADQLGAETALLLVGSDSQLPGYPGTLYLADAATCGKCVTHSTWRLLPSSRNMRPTIGRSLEPPTR